MIEVVTWSATAMSTRWSDLEVRRQPALRGAPLTLRPRSFDDLRSER
jgi:hypothetical protein